MKPKYELLETLKRDNEYGLVDHYEMIDVGLTTWKEQGKIKYGRHLVSLDALAQKIYNGDVT